LYIFARFGKLCHEKSGSTSASEVDKKCSYQSWEKRALEMNEK
jgi:hypothetical protein